MPERPVVVLVHGAVERAATFSEVVDQLSGLDVVTYDRRGHGSRWGEGVATLEEDVDELLDVLGDGVSTVVGHSLGGLVVLGAALRRPELFRSVGLYETAIPWGDWWTEREHATMLEEIEHNTSSVNAKTPEEQARLETAWASCREQVLEAFEGPFRWQDLRVPLTLAYGTESRNPSARDTRVLEEFFGIEAVVLQGAGHRAPKTNPDAFAAFVRRCAA